MREFTFHKTIKSSKEKPKNLLNMILLDIGFLALFVLATWALIDLFAGTDLLTSFGQNVFTIILVVFIIILYFAIILFVYSLFSLLIFGNLKNITESHQHDMSLLKNMFLVNLVIFFIFFLLMVIFYLCINLFIDQAIWLFAVFLLIVFIVLVIIYAYHNFSQALLIKKFSLGKIFSNAARHTFTRSYVPLILFDIGVVLAFLIAYSAIGLVLKVYSPAMYLVYQSPWSLIPIFIVVYAVFFYNRLHFYFIAEKSQSGK